MEASIRSFLAEGMRVNVYPDRESLGRAAGEAAARAMKNALSAVFASAASQVEFLAELARQPEVDWARLTAFHLDEYVGKPMFARFLRERLFDRVRPRAFHALDGTAQDLEAECLRYEALLREHPLDVAFVGIGENGHLAFNDPHAADFRDPRRVKVVEPDLQSRKQQVADGCFGRVDEVPSKAFTLTIPAILSARQIFVMVPGARKAEALRRTLREPVSTDCPATILRGREGVSLFLDSESSRLIDTELAR